MFFFFFFLNSLPSHLIKVFIKEEKTKYTSILNNLANGNKLLSHLHIARLYERMMGSDERGRRV